MKKRNSITNVLILIIIISIFLTGCIITDENNNGQGNNQNLYTINLPKNWISINPINDYDAIYTPDQNSNIYFYIKKHWM